MPKRKWTLENCKASAANYSTRSAWKKGEGSAYTAAVKNKWVNECCLHMDTVFEEWTLARCITSAKRYGTKREWEACDRKAYQAAKRRKSKGWLEACCQHMTPKIIRWTLDMCLSSAKKYQTKSEWQRSEPKAYDAAIRHREESWFEQCVAHMKPAQKQWTLEECLESARRYRTKNDWSNGDQNAYSAAWRNKADGWFARCVAHMEPSRRNWTLEECLESARQYDTREAWRKGDRKAHYAAYSRKEEGWFEQCVAHMKPTRKQWTFEECLKSARQYDTRRAWKKGDHRAFFTAYSRKDKGWLEQCIAHMKPARKQWTLEECLESARRYDTRKSWREGDYRAYYAAYYRKEKGWLEQCVAHMKPACKQWLLKECLESALRYNTRGAWQKGDRRAYAIAYSKKEKGWFEQCVAHMESSITRWTFDLCLASAKKFNTISEWRSHDRDAYYAALRNKDKGWFDKCTTHLKYAYARHTDASCIRSALKYSSREEWKNSDLAAFNYAVKNGLMKKCCKHIVDIYRANILKECKLSALKYQTRIEWRNGDKRTYRFAIYYGFLDECTQHMTSFRKDHTLESCMASAKRYTTKMDWHNEDYLAYKAAQKNKDGWLEKCTAHMDVINIIWTLDECMASARNFITISEWRREEPKAYAAASSNRWLDAIYRYFNSLLDTITFDECIQDAADFDNWSEWAKSDNLFYVAAKSKSWAFICKDVIIGNTVQKWNKNKNLKRAD
tara:strand:- start:741 stop:2930 length:2190 start_codon:yes stop_codon:yes gene_type:complete